MVTTWIRDGRYRASAFQVWWRGGHLGAVPSATAGSLVVGVAAEAVGVPADALGVAVARKETPSTAGHPVS